MMLIEWDQRSSPQRRYCTHVYATFVVLSLEDGPEPIDVEPKDVDWWHWEDQELADFFGTDDWTRWLIEHGIAPGQEFTVRFEAPRGVKYWTDCGYEYDTEYGNYYITWIENLETTTVTLAWVGALAGAFEVEDKLLTLSRNNTS
jgi:hypothetical protein